MGVKPNRTVWLAKNKKPVAAKANETVPNTAKPLVASDLLKSAHPLHETFNNWCVQKSVEPSKRQARKFLDAHPAYRQASQA
jgi:hypothetical protein